MPLKSGKNNVSENIKELTAAGHSQEQAVAIALKKAYDENDNPPQYYGEQISDNMILTPEGFLVCLNVTIATTAMMKYLNSEIGLETNEEWVYITNPPEELLSPSTIASFNAKPVTMLHPDKQILDAETAKEKTVGFVTNVKGVDNQRLVADLIIIDAEIIQSVKGGIKEVSCGYEATAVADNGDGTGFRKGIIGNHVAIVPNGRCGAQCAINDSKESDLTKDEKKSLLDSIKALFVNDAKAKDENEEKEDVFDAKASYDALAKDFADFKASILNKDAKAEDDESKPETSKLDEVLTLLQKLVEMETKEGMDAKKANDSANVQQPKIAITDAEQKTANDSCNCEVMTASKLNEHYAKFYGKGN